MRRAHGQQQLALRLEDEAFLPVARGHEVTALEDDAEGAAHRRTLIVPQGTAVDNDLVEIATLIRREVDQMVVAYNFDLRTNELSTTLVANPNAGREHNFKVYRVAGDPTDAVTLRDRRRVAAMLAADEAASDDE